MLTTVANHAIARFVAVLSHIMPRVLPGNTHTKLISVTFSANEMVVANITMVKANPIPVRNREIVHTVNLFGDFSEPAFPLEHEVAMPSGEDDTIVVEIEDAIHGTILGVFVQSGTATISVTEGDEVVDGCFLELRVIEGISVLVVGLVDDNISGGPVGGSSDDVYEDLELLVSEFSDVFAYSVLGNVTVLALPTIPALITGDTIKVALTLAGMLEESSRPRDTIIDDEHGRNVLFRYCNFLAVAHIGTTTNLPVVAVGGAAHSVRMSRVVNTLDGNEG